MAYDCARNVNALPHTPARAKPQVRVLAVQKQRFIEQPDLVEHRILIERGAPAGEKHLRRPVAHMPISYRADAAATIDSSQRGPATASSFSTAMKSADDCLMAWFTAAPKPAFCRFSMIVATPRTPSVRSARPEPELSITTISTSPRVCAATERTHSVSFAPAVRVGMATVTTGK